jgi:hypothetical protein
MPLSADQNGFHIIRGAVTTTTARRNEPHQARRQHGEPSVTPRSKCEPYRGTII